MDKFEEIQQSLDAATGKGMNSFDRFLDAADGSQAQALHTIDDVRGYLTMKVDNNIYGVVRALQNAGYTNIPADRIQLGKFMMDVYSQNKNLFLDILDAVPYNAGANNYTTDPNFLAGLKEIVDKMKK